MQNTTHNSETGTDKVSRLSTTVKVIYLKQAFGMSENPTWLVEKIEEVAK